MPMDPIDRWLGKTQSKLELRLQPKLMQLLKEEAQKEGKSVNGIIRNCIIESYIQQIAELMRIDIKVRLKAGRKGR